MPTAFPDDLDAEADFGPAVKRLTDQQRAFVFALLDQGGKPNYAAAARTAGYSDTKEGAKVRGHAAAHNSKVIDALHEEAGKRFRLLGWAGVRGLARIASDRKHPDHFKANKELADRFGFSAVTEHKVTVEKTDLTGAALMARIMEVASKLGVDPVVLLGENAAPPKMRQIEAQVVEVTDIPRETFNEAEDAG